MAANVQDNPWWYQPCLDTIAQLGGQPCGTSLSHCNDGLIPRYVEAICSCGPGYENGCRGPNPPPNCCSYTAASPVPILSENCYCCCGCMANHTPVAASATEYKAIEDFATGDQVYVAEDVSLKAWSQKTVEWSSGTGPGTNTMIRVSYGDEQNNDFLIVNRAQPFLMADRKLKLAAKLVPGSDALVTQTGDARPVISLEIGTFDQGLHHIATTSTAATSPDGHLILAKGIVCGDWALQVALSSATADTLGIAPGHADDPEVGTRAYQEAHSQLTHTPFAAQTAIAADLVVQSDSRFAALAESSTYVPEDAAVFLTEDQAWELQGKVKQAPPTSDAGQPILRYLFKLFGGFYPGVVFYLDNRNLLPNAYAFESYGQQVVVVNGGLIRTQGVGFETLAFVTARAIAALDGSPPVNDAGYSCTGQADYAALSGVMPQVWIGLQSVPVIKGAISQVTALFKEITENTGGSDTCMGVALDCRLEAMQAAFDMAPLPACAGGPAEAALEVGSASGNIGDPHGTATVTFNLPVDPDSAEALGNYAFDPLVDTYSATVANDAAASVEVSADLTRDTEYTVTVTGVLSQDGQPLVAGKNSAKFTAGGTS